MPVLFSIIIICFSVAWVEAVNATTYYVDATGGNDNNNGMSSGTAWKSLTKVNSVLLNSGDTVLFKRGETWRGQLLPNSGSESGGTITYKDYGDSSLPKPLLLGSTERNNTSDWVNVGGNIWESASWLDAAVPTGNELLSNPSFTSNSNGWSLHVNSSSSAVVSAYGRTTSVYDTSPAGYRIVCSSQGNVESDIQLYTSSIPIAVDEYYILSFRAKCTQSFTMNKITLHKMISPYTEYGSYYTGQNPTIGTQWATYKMICKARSNASDGRITFYLGNSLPAGSTFYIDTLSFKRGDNISDRLPLEVDIGNIIFNQGESCGVKVWTEQQLSIDKSGSTPVWIPEQKQGRFWYDATNKKVKIYSLSNPANYYNNIELARKDSIVHANSGHYITFENLSLRNGAGHGFYFYEVHHINVKNSDVSFIGGGFQYYRGDGLPVRFGNGIEIWNNANNCLIEGCKIWEIYDAGLTNQGTENINQSNIYYRNNIVWNSECSYEFFLGTGSVVNNIYVENNTFVNAGLGWGQWQRTDCRNGRHLRLSSNLGETDNFFVRNNILTEATESCMQMVYPDSSTQNVILF